MLTCRRAPGLSPARGSRTAAAGVARARGCGRTRQEAGQHRVSPTAPSAEATPSLTRHLPRRVTKERAQSTAALGYGRTARCLSREGIGKAVNKSTLPPPVILPSAALLIRGAGRAFAHIRVTEFGLCSSVVIFLCQITYSDLSFTPFHSSLFTKVRNKKHAFRGEESITK